MPKAPLPSRIDRWRPGPYGAWISPSLSIQSHSTPTGGRYQSEEDYRPRSQKDFREPPTAPRAMGVYNASAQQSRMQSPASYHNENPPPASGSEIHRDSVRDDPPAIFYFEDGEIPQHPQQVQKPLQGLQDPVAQQRQEPQTSQPAKRSRELTRVNRMSLQVVPKSNRNGRQKPGLRIHSIGGGVQFNIFSRVPDTSQTVAFNVEDEEALLKVYRMVKAMNPGADVGGIMFSVATKAAHPSQADNLSWDFLAGRHGNGGRITINLPNNVRFNCQ